VFNDVQRVHMFALHMFTRSRIHVQLAGLSWYIEAYVLVWGTTDYRVVSILYVGEVSGVGRVEFRPLGPHEGVFSTASEGLVAPSRSRGILVVWSSFFFFGVHHASFQ
jgi:hypothetical protein